VRAGERIDARAGERLTLLLIVLEWSEALGLA